MATISDRKTWPVVNQQTRAKKGPLLRVRHADGHYTKMYEADAIAAGLIPGNKQARAPENKMIATPSENKAVAEPDEAPADDFTTIPGVGKASARSLVAQGITSFAQLKSAELGELNLSAGVLKSIEEWRG